jgi:hypothetical protein
MPAGRTDYVTGSSHVCGTYTAIRTSCTWAQHFCSVTNNEFIHTMLMCWHWLFFAPAYVFFDCIRYERFSIFLILLFLLFLCSANAPSSFSASGSGRVDIDISSARRTYFSSDHVESYAFHFVSALLAAGSPQPANRKCADN